MRLIKTYIIIILLTFLASSCKENTMKDIEDGKWNNERSIIKIEFEEQIGATEIVRDEDGNAIVKFLVNMESADLSSVKVKYIEISYGAKSNVNIGDELDFENAANTAFIQITSKSGKVRDWQIVATPFEEILAGSWRITGLWNYGGTGVEYGGGALDMLASVDNPDAMYWNWPMDGEGAKAEIDNILTFSLEGVRDNGNPYGTIVHDPGEDQHYANFVLNDGGTAYDVNHHYRVIPKGKSTWERNTTIEGEFVTFTDENGKKRTMKFVGAGTEELPGQNAPFIMTIPNNAFSIEFQTKENWETIYSLPNRFVDNPKKFWVLVEKVK